MGERFFTKTRRARTNYFRHEDAKTRKRFGAKCATTEDTANNRVHGRRVLSHENTKTRNKIELRSSSVAPLLRVRPLLRPLPLSSTLLATKTRKTRKRFGAKCATTEDTASNRVHGRMVLGHENTKTRKRFGPNALPPRTRQTTEFTDEHYRPRKLESTKEKIELRSFSVAPLLRVRPLPPSVSASSTAFSHENTKTRSKN
jgi:hypothetical protein